MQGLLSCFPSPALRPYVRAYAQRWTAVTDAAIIQPTPAQAEQVLEFEFGNPVEALFTDGTNRVCSQTEIIGIGTRSDSRPYATQLTLPPGVESFAVFFKPAGFSQLFGIPMYETTNRACDATLVAGSCVKTLWNVLAENPRFESRVRTVEQFLLKRATSASAQHDSGDIANYILHRHGTIGMMDLADRSRLGLRQFERVFLNEVGCCPKIFARVSRFQSALDAKVANPNRKWLELAHEFRYHDQMHMIHDFEKLGGNSPGDLLSLLGDMRPPALASAQEVRDIEWRARGGSCRVA